MISIFGHIYPVVVSTITVSLKIVKNENTVQPVLSKHLRDNQDLLVEDRSLLNNGAFQCICLFREFLLNTSCLLDRGSH